MKEKVYVLARACLCAHLCARRRVHGRYLRRHALVDGRCAQAKAVPRTYIVELAVTAPILALHDLVALLVQQDAHSHPSLLTKCEIACYNVLQ